MTASAVALAFSAHLDAGSYAPVERVPSGSFASRLLEAHNAERVRVGVPALEWDAELARQAKDWADSLARRQALIHADREVRDGAGENLWTGAAGYYTAEEMIGTFADEQRHFVPGVFPKISRTGQWRDVGHYTQIVWRQTRKVGCAVSPGGGQDWLVCRYWPAGNTAGQSVY